MGLEFPIWGCGFFTALGPAKGAETRTAQGNWKQLFPDQVSPEPLTLVFMFIHPGNTSCPESGGGVSPAAGVGAAVGEVPGAPATLLRSPSLSGQEPHAQTVWVCSTVGGGPAGLWGWGGRGPETGPGLRGDTAQGHGPAGLGSGHEEGAAPLSGVKVPT